MSAFKNRIYDLRKDAQLSQQQLADKIGVNKQTISQYERGIREPQFETLGKLCDFFNVSVDYLLGRDAVTARLLNSDEIKLIDAYRSNSVPLLPLSEEEGDVIHKYRGASEDTKSAVCAVLGVKRKDAGCYRSRSNAG